MFKIKVHSSLKVFSFKLFSINICNISIYFLISNNPTNKIIVKKKHFTRKPLSRLSVIDDR